MKTPDNLRRLSSTLHYPLVGISKCQGKSRLLKYHSYSAIIPELIFDNRRGPGTGPARAFLQNYDGAVERRVDRRGRMGGWAGDGDDDRITITVA